MSPSSDSASLATVVVGVGASAGGVEARGTFLDHELHTSGAAFLIATHMSSARPSSLPEILARHTGMLDLRWQESAGLPVTPPNRRGFGTLLRKRQLAYELNAQSDIDYAPDGLVVTIHIPRAPSSAAEAS